MPEEPPLKRESAGRYRTRDGRFAVEQNSGRWLVLDSDQTDELGMPLLRGPFPSLDDAREAIRAARTGPAPTSPLRKRAKASSARRAKAEPSSPAPGRSSSPEPEAEPAPPPQPPPLVIRRLEPGDGRILRWLSEEADAFEASPTSRLSATAPRQPALDTTAARHFLAQPDVHLLVALEADEPLGFLLAYELLRRHGDPIRLFVHEVCVRTERRREGIGRRLLDSLWAIGRERGIGSAFVLAQADDRGAVAFYRAAGGKRSKGDAAVIRFSTGAD
jgi:ribosomal protein S18 acetylase RimI-like enzyme